MPLYDALGYFEKQLAKAQGKGFGSNSIKSEINCISKLLNGNEPTLCIDIGGNVGNYSAELLNRYKHAQIVCFEPSATNISLLENRFGRESRLILEPVGVAEHPGTVTLFADTPGSGLGSMTKRDLSHFGRNFDNEEQIQIIRFEQYWRDTLHRSPIDLLKLDIEGHEMDALRGCGDAIEATRVVQFEFGGSNIDTRTYFRDFWHYFRDHGFQLYRITPLGLAKLKRYRERDECFRTTNFLAARPHM